MNETKDDDLAAIEQVLAGHPDGASALEIRAALPDALAVRTLQYRLKRLTDRDRIVRDGNGRWARYRLPVTETAGPSGAPKETAVAMSEAAAAIRAYVRQPQQARTPVGYDRRFLDAYRPNTTAYLSAQERAHLAQVGALQISEQAAGTYAKHILNRLLIDLSWNSSRLEGNTYSLLDTRRLIELGEEAEGRGQLDAQMILNHKDAIEFLVGAADDIGFNRYTILNLHAMLANNLLADPQAAGRLRYIAVGIERSVFHPLEVPQLIEECFDEILVKAAAIEDPFEQAFFAMVQLPYLQPFDDVNKRVSRLAANIPLIRQNLAPLSFADVPRQIYTEAVLGVYELKKVDLLKDVFIWAYARSAARYAAVRQSLGEPDPLRMRYRTEMLALLRAIIVGGMDRKRAVETIALWSNEHIGAEDRQAFVDIAETELVGLHEGNFARYRIRPSEFETWQEVWQRP